jgi:hypothetical protein
MTIVRPSDYGGEEAISLSWDFGSVKDSEKKRLVKAWVAELPRLANLKRLRIWAPVTQPVFDAACELHQLEVLQIKWGSFHDLGAIAALQGLQALFIGSSTRVASIEPLVTLTSLKVLEIESLKRISDFTPLKSLKSLRSLAVTGSTWSRQAIECLEPFASMTWLTSLAIDTSKVSSLGPLGTLAGLRELALGGRLPYEEYAWLSARLPSTACRWFSPYYELAGTGHSACTVCHRDSMVMLTGRGKPTLCKHCDASKVDRHVRQFEAARVEARNAK